MKSQPQAYVALLRGINVGGKNIIRMTDLKGCFERQGYAEVSTYIQSGNVLFCSTDTDVDRLTDAVEQMLSKQFGYTARVVVVSHAALKQVVENAPDGFGTRPAKYRYDVIFLRKPLTAREALKSVTTKEGVDRVDAGKQVLYFSRLVNRASESRMRLIIGTPVYQSMTIRNWNTTVKLLELLESGI
jgi:uncharacterized protein (DUF1697 family)